MIESFDTERLVGRRLQPRHLEFLTDLHQSPEVMATLGGVRSPEQTAEFLETKLHHWDQHGFGLWILALAEQPES